MVSFRSTSNTIFQISALEKANISKIVFLRHGQTRPSTTGVDFDRLLTDDGKEQSREAGLSFGLPCWRETPTRMNDAKFVPLLQELHVHVV